MASSNKLGFAAEVHLDIKYKVTIDMFVSYRVVFNVIKDMKCNSNIGHFFLNRVMPKSVVILLVNFVRFFGQSRYLHTKLVGLFEETCFDLSDYVVSILKSIGYSPGKDGFFKNSIPYNIFYNIHRV